MRMRSICKRLVWLCALTLMAALLCGFAPEGQKVYDDAQLFTQEERQELEREAQEAAVETKCDFVIVTTYDTEGKSAEAYADDFFDENGFGYEGPRGTGILLLFDMGGRNIQISTSGQAFIQITDSTYTSDDEINALLDDMWPDIESGDYADAAEIFIRQTKDKYLVNNEYRYMDGVYNESTQLFEFTERKATFGEKVLDPMRLLSTAVLSLILAGVIVGVMVMNQKAGRTASSRNYLDGDVRIKRERDRFTHTTTRVRTIETPKSSGGGGGGGGHTSSSGSTHGGGGRSF